MSGLRTFCRMKSNAVVFGCPPLEQLHARNLQAFLEDLARGRRPHDAADVRHVRDDADEADEPPSRNTGRAALTSLRWPVPIHGSLVTMKSPAFHCSIGNASSRCRIVRGIVPLNGGQPAVGCATTRPRESISTIGEILGLAHDRRERRAQQEVGRLVEDRDETAPRDLECDRVERDDARSAASGVFLRSSGSALVRRSVAMTFRNASTRAVAPRRHDDRRVASPR